MTQELDARGLGPDGKEWAKTEAGYAHVERMVPRADFTASGPLWYGWAVREAFVAGAEWQESRALSAAPVMGVKVKPLEWEFHGEVTEATAEVLVGQYFALLDGSSWTLRLNYVAGGDCYQTVIADALPAISDVFAIAQADFDRRTLTALEPVAAPDEGLVRAVGEYLSEIDNPAPDYAYRHTLRERMRAAAARSAR